MKFLDQSLQKSTDKTERQIWQNTWWQPHWWMVTIMQIESAIVRVHSRIVYSPAESLSTPDIISFHSWKTEIYTTAFTWLSSSV